MARKMDTDSSASTTTENKIQFVFRLACKYYFQGEISRPLCLVHLSASKKNSGLWLYTLYAPVRSPDGCDVVSENLNWDLKEEKAWTDKWKVTLNKKKKKKNAKLWYYSETMSFLSESTFRGHNQVLTDKLEITLFCPNIFSRYI